MMSEDLGIEIICDELAVHPLVKDLGSHSSWGSIPAMVRKQMCAKHVTLMNDAGIDLTKCHENRASASRVSHLRRDRYRILQSQSNEISCYKNLEYNVVYGQ
ncbi:hypothetical protein PHYBLDRAFT_72722 [Phycomyces blakesleeanus NRRL 1555(-)]|uniref:Uncharacterized protein n=1 Tax=Phycomyces blakesleeanus (strain ATCC 8743b / DSM 1359 / FGSC 10004 / NBRC 33097 / NRRL 1555) TaxID=763407 RepID=A0A162U2F3_PHYB8|nr:hypothetical protein PHYBLDRAFT_72722 [Phycomyces blakesleeanus NRRL 1555(-)]OAD71793.1 hypothetical protein PHYBLDRAFT_72722 [Phycomyces blakesleeanus NRRL 1555(-)]|eukprot:XP_018289833.1 hypothetical protein PHYBLDRAFT_72722 [Phycomyces blakesleeanus NRRL 1555(-)]